MQITTNKTTGVLYHYVAEVVNSSACPGSQNFPLNILKPGFKFCHAKDTNFVGMQSFLSFECLSVNYWVVHLLLTKKLNLIPKFHTDQSRARKNPSRAWHNQGHTGAFSGRMERKVTYCSRQSENKDIVETMEEAEGLDINDENGEFMRHYMYAT